MATNTTNLGLIKPNTTDKYDINVFNENMDIIDEQLGNEIHFTIREINKNYNLGTWFTFKGATWQDVINNDTSGTFTADGDRACCFGSPLAYNGRYYILVSEEIVAGGIYDESVCCFEAGTQILVALDGTTRNIENIEIGDQVISYNEETGQFFRSKIAGLQENTHVTDIAEVILENGMSVRMNAYHPLLTVEGYKSLTCYNNLPLLTENDIIITKEGQSAIKSINRGEKDPEHMYNLTLSGLYHNYVANGIVVHNASCASTPV